MHWNGWWNVWIEFCNDLWGFGIILRYGRSWFYINIYCCISYVRTLVDSIWKQMINGLCHLIYLQIPVFRSSLNTIADFIWIRIILMEYRWLFLFLWKNVRLIVNNKTKKLILFCCYLFLTQTKQWTLRQWHGYLSLCS